MEKIVQPAPEVNKNRWLIKFAPFRTNWGEIIRAGIFALRGVRSPTARKHLRAMRLGDSVFFYQSQQNQSVVGVLEVVREAYPDPTSADPQWLTCDFRPVETLPSPVSLAAIKSDSRLQSMALLRSPRLSVMPVSREEAAIIRHLSVTNAGTQIQNSPDA